MSQGMFDLGKWNEKTAQLVRKRCHDKEMLCIGVALIFYDPFKTERELILEERTPFYVTIDLAFDPENPPAEIQQARVKAALQYVAKGVQKIFEGGADNDIH